MLAHPLTRGLDVDDPRTTEVRRQIIRQKAFLRLIYEEWYRSLQALLPGGTEPILELGSGAGFMRAYVPGLITSEVLRCSGVDVVLDAQALPLRDNSLRAIVMSDVLHHLPRVAAFFAEASRCVRVGGSVVMVEPWVTAWSRFVYQYLHHEPFVPSARAWEFPSSGPLSGANSALPWIVFKRDRQRFEREFPTWRVRTVQLTMPFSYLLSGGLSRASFMPGWAFTSWRSVERALEPWMDTLGMFAYIVLDREGSE